VTVNAGAEQFEAVEVLLEAHTAFASADKKEFVPTLHPQPWPKAPPTQRVPLAAHPEAQRESIGRTSLMSLSPRCVADGSHGSPRPKPRRATHWANEEMLRHREGQDHLRRELELDELTNRTITVRS
jgi:hypothetical protein